MKIMKNKVTIYVPTKNRVDLLKRAVDSVQAQTYTNWELIVVNDASTDGTYQYLEDIKSSKIKVIHQPESQGACVARNLAINSATGDFVTGLDDDDYFEPNRLQLFIDGWKAKPENVSVLFAGRKHIKDGVFVREKTNSFDIVKRKDLFIKNFIGNQVFTPVENLRKIGGFDTNLRMWQDLECWLRLLNVSDAMQIKETSYCIDISDRTDRITNSQKEKIRTTYNYIVDKHHFNFFQKKAFESYFLIYDNNIRLKIQKLVFALSFGVFYKAYLKSK